jgi:hypothetical protein
MIVNEEIQTINGKKYRIENFTIDESKRILSKDFPRFKTLDKNTKILTAIAFAQSYKRIKEELK